MATSPPLILMLTHSYFPNDPRIRRCARALGRAGFRVRVVGTSLDSVAKRATLGEYAIESWETQVVKTRQSPIRYVSQYLRTTIACRRAVAESIRNDRVSAVYVNTLPDFLIYAATPARRRRIPTILDFHESLPDFYGSKFGLSQRALPVRVLEFVERRCARRADHLVTVNEEIADTFERRLHRRPLVLMNSVDEDLFDWRRKDPLWPDGPKRLSYHGTLTDIYGLDLLIKSLPQVLKVHPGTSFDVFGDGPARPGLEQLASRLGLSDSVRFHGSIPLNEVSGALREVHLGVVPTRKDYFLDMALSTKLMEYVFLGIPVLSTNLRAIQREFHSDPGVFYFEGNSLDSLTRSLIHVLGLPRASIASAIAGARSDYEKHAWPRVSEKLVSFLRNVTRTSE